MLLSNERSLAKKRKICAPVHLVSESKTIQSSHLNNSTNSAEIQNIENTTNNIQNVENTTRIKENTTNNSHQTKNNSHNYIKAKTVRNNDCELTTTDKSIKKRKLAKIHHLNKDVSCVMKSKFKEKVQPLQLMEPTSSKSGSPEQLLPTLSIKEKRHSDSASCSGVNFSGSNDSAGLVATEPLYSHYVSSEQLLSTSTKEELMQCDTAPVTPTNLSTSVSQISSFTSEELQFSLLQNFPEESGNLNLKSSSEAFSFSTKHVEGAIIHSDIPKANNILNDRKTENLAEFADELQNSLDTKNKSSISLEELYLCTKTLNFVSSHLKTNFASKNKLIKSLTDSIEESVKQLLASSNDHQNLKTHEKNNHHQLENRVKDIRKHSKNLIDDLTSFQIKYSDKEECVASCSYDTVTSEKRLAEFQYSDSKSPFHENLSDPRIKTKEKSLSISVSTANPVNPEEILEDSCAPYSHQFSNSKSSYKSPLDSTITTKLNSKIFSKSFSSTNPKDMLENDFESDSPRYSDAKSPSHFNNLDPRTSIKNKSTIYSKALFCTNTINPRKILENNFESYCHQMQIPVMKPSISMPPSKKLCLDQNYDPFFNKGHKADMNSFQENSISVVNLIPHSLIQDLGVNFIKSSHVYLIIIGWREEWFSEYEKKSQINSSASLPPILYKSNTLSKVQHSYQGENEHYSTYLKLLLAECWYKLFLSWKNLRQLKKEYFGKIRHHEVKTGYVLYVVEYFVSATEKDSMPNKSSILQLKFTKLDNTYFSALGFVSNVENRTFDALYDSNNEAFKVLNTSGENILKYKVVFYTVYKCNEIDTKKMLTHKKLVNIRNVLQQNDALMNLQKSPLCRVILDPVMSSNKLNLSIPDSSGSVYNPLKQMCQQILTTESLLVSVNSSLSFANKVSVIYNLIKNVLDAKPGSKVIICSKSEKTLSEISNNNQKHGVVLINQDLAPKLQKYSVKELVRKKMDCKGGLTGEDAQLELLNECSVISMLYPGRYQNDILKAQDVACCILDNAHEFTEPESIIPLTYGITKFVLFGNKAKQCDVSQITANYGYNCSLLNRIAM